MTHRTVALIVTQTEEGFVVLDANGVMHEAQNPAALGDVCSAIVADTSLPEYETKTPEPELPIRFAQALLPENLGFMAQPAVELLKKAVTKIQTKTAAPKKIRSTEESRQAGTARALSRREEKDRLKAIAKEAARARRKMPFVRKHA